MTQSHKKHTAPLEAYLQTLPHDRPSPGIIDVTTDVVACDGGDAAGHPRVYLTIKAANGFVPCPYCGCIYVLDPHAPRSAAH